MTDLSKQIIQTIRINHCCTGKKVNAIDAGKWSFRIKDTQSHWKALCFAIPIVTSITAVNAVSIITAITIAIVTTVAVDRGT